jgi:hypothetical protein
MQTIEFEDVIDNGVITIPKEFKSITQNGTKVKIIIKPIPLRKTDLFPFAEVDMSGFVFKRDAINER